jgi:hypothetical protein
MGDLRDGFQIDDIRIGLPKLSTKIALVLGQSLGQNFPPCRDRQKSRQYRTP